MIDRHGQLNVSRMTWTADLGQVACRASTRLIRSVNVDVRTRPDGRDLRCVPPGSKRWVVEATEDGVKQGVEGVVIFNSFDGDGLNLLRR